MERHFTILKHDETRDGVVSITPEQITFLSDIYAKPRQTSEEWLNLEFPNYQEIYEKLSDGLGEEELLNRDYYRGRFVNKSKTKQEYCNYV